MGPLAVFPICPTTDESLENASAVYTMTLPQIYRSVVIQCNRSSKRSGL